MDLQLPDPNAGTTPTTTLPATMPPATPGAPPGDAAAQIRKALNPIALSGEQIKEWLDRIDRSTQRRKDRSERWDTLLNRYLPHVKTTPGSEDVKVNLHFRNVQTKIGQLFVRSPDIRLVEKGVAKTKITLPPQAPGQPPQTLSAADAVPIRKAVINQYMGPGEEFIDGVALMDECLFDGLAWAGLWGAKVSYSAVSRPVDQPVMGPDPNWKPAPPAPGSMMGLAPQVPPQIQTGTQTVNVPIYQKWDADRISPKKLLLDDLLTSSRHHRYSRWVGHNFIISPRLAKKKFGLTDEDLKPIEQDDNLFKPDTNQPQNAKGGSKDQIAGVEVFCFGANFFDDEDHPQAVYQLVFLDNIKDRTVICRKSLDQTFDPATGVLTTDSLVGLPIRIGCLRVMADSAYPESDSAFTDTHVKQLTTSRRQSIQLRDAAIGKYFYDTSAIDPDDLDKIKNGEVGAFVGLKGGVLQQGADKVFLSTAQVKRTPDDYQLENRLKNEIDETLGISAVQSGTPLDTVHSATEVAAVQADSNGRQEKERARAIEWYLDIVRCVDTLIFRYAHGDRYVSVVGKDGAAKLQAWNKTLGAGCYAYGVRVDSQLTSDSRKDRQDKLGLLNVAAPDPLVNRAPIWRDVFEDFGYDPSECIRDPAAVAADQLAMQNGMPPSQPPHPGAANKHVGERTGNLPNGPGTQGHGRDARPGAAGPPAAPPGAAHATPVGQPMQAPH